MDSGNVAAQMLYGACLQYRRTIDFEGLQPKRLKHLNDVFGNHMLFLPLLKAPNAFAAEQTGASQRHGSHNLALNLGQALWGCTHPNAFSRGTEQKNSGPWVGLREALKGLEGLHRTARVGPSSRQDNLLHHAVKAGLTRLLDKIPIVFFAVRVLWINRRQRTVL
jgi:hypothetical protein